MSKFVRLMCSLVAYNGAHSLDESGLLQVKVVRHHVKAVYPPWLQDPLWINKGCDCSRCEGDCSRYECRKPENQCYHATKTPDYLQWDCGELSYYECKLPFVLVVNGFGEFKATKCGTARSKELVGFEYVGYTTTLRKPRWNCMFQECSGCKEQKGGLKVRTCRKMLHYLIPEGEFGNRKRMPVPILDEDITISEIKDVMLGFMDGTYKITVGGRERTKVLVSEKTVDPTYCY